MSKIRCIQKCTVPRNGHCVFVGKGMVIDNIYDEDEPCLKYFEDVRNGQRFNPPYRPPRKLSKTKAEIALEEREKELAGKLERLEALEERLMEKLADAEKPAKSSKSAKSKAKAEDLDV